MVYVMIKEVKAGAVTLICAPRIGAQPMGCVECARVWKRDCVVPFVCDLPPNI